ncbi:hypothetical protein EKD04_019895 [Chloroflexales bacterium ZM16-3]|nr:hypothetical protein [Chloroflexales bacterium ZM16-3]
MFNSGIGQLLFWLLVAMGTALLVALIGLALMVRQIRRLPVPPDAGFFTTMRYVPLLLVVLLDLLDFALDIFSAPISWIILDRMGLRGLRNKAVIEALIPFTQPIPTFTLSWVAARLLDLGDLEERVISYNDDPPYRRLP